jgi:HAE1 family hydrophobic/amphiphilic exporter-1
VTHLNAKNWFHKPLIWFEGIISKLTAWYTNQLKWTLGHKVIATAVVIAAFVATGVVMKMGILGQEMVASGDRGQILMKLEYDKSTSITDNNIRSLAIENYLLSLPEVETVFSNIGGPSSSSVIATIGSENKSELTIGLVDKSKRELTTAQLMLQIREHIESVNPGLEVNASVIGITQSDEPIQIVLNSEDNLALMKATNQLKSLIKSLPGANDVSASVEEGNPELTVTLDRGKDGSIGP